MNNMNSINEIYEMQCIYEIQCKNLIYDCIILVTTPCMYLAKIEIIKNFIDSDLSKYIADFKPYKSRLYLNIPLLQNNIKYHLYSLLSQFYDIGKNKKYYVIEGSEGSHEDIDDLVIKICTILSNKMLGKNVVDKIDVIDTNLMYL